MIVRNKITISFLPSDSELWGFLQSKKETCNVSEYIRNLIRQDMNDGTPFGDEEKIVERILQALQNSEVGLPMKKSEEIEYMLVNEETKRTISNLF